MGRGKGGNRCQRGRTAGFDRGREIRYAENIVGYNNSKLKLIGWTGKNSGESCPVRPQPRLLEAPGQGAGWVFLDWETPAEGAKPLAYKIQRRNLLRDRILTCLEFGPFNRLQITKN